MTTSLSMIFACLGGLALAGCAAVPQGKVDALSKRIDQMQARIDRDERALVTVNAKCDVVGDSLAAEKRTIARDEREIAALSTRLNNVVRTFGEKLQTTASPMPQWAGPQGSVAARTAESKPPKTPWRPVPLKRVSTPLGPS